MTSTTTTMNYSSHPYASTSASVVAANSPLRRNNAKSHRPKRPSISTCVANSSQRPLDILPDLSEEDSDLSPITFLDVGRATSKHNARRISKPRPIGLTGLEHFELESYLRNVPRTPSPRSPAAVEVKSPTESVTLTFDGLSLDFPTPPVPFASHSPASTSKSLDTSTSPSTPAMPLTPASSDDEFTQSVAPLSISKPSSVNRSSNSSRTSTRSEVARMIAPLDTIAANNLDLGLDLSLTGMLDEIRRSQYLPSPPPCPELDRSSKKEAVVEEEEKEEDWVDWTPEDDAIAARDYYRSDIATHLQLFSPPAFTNPFAPASTASQRPGHRRFPSSLSSNSQHQIPPARPDSLPPPPQAFAGPSATPIHASFFRRASANSLASTVSARSNRSIRSNASRSSRSSARYSVSSLKGRRVSTRAARSARMGIQGKRRSSTSPVEDTKPLPPTPSTASTTGDVAPLLDPGFPRRFIPTRPPPPPPTKAMSSTPERRRTRPPPRSSLPIDVDFSFDETDADVTVPECGMRVMLDGVMEEDEEDPFLPVFVDIGGAGEAPAKLPQLKIEPTKEAPASLQADVPFSPLSDSSQSLSPIPESEGEERILRSRWSTSTLGSFAAPQTASSARSVFAKLQSFTIKKSPKKRVSDSISPQQQQQQQQPQAARPFPFFPTPTPPSPTKKRTPGPGPYIPKPSLSPSASSTVSASTSSPSPSPARSSTSRAPTVSPSPSPSSKSCTSSSTYTAQYAQYAAYKSSSSSSPKPPSPTPSARSLSSFAFSFPSSSSNASSSGSSCGGHGARYAPNSGSVSPTHRVKRQSSQISRSSFASDRTSDSAESTASSGLRRKPIPVEIFMRC